MSMRLAFSTAVVPDPIEVICEDNAFRNSSRVACGAAMINLK